MRGGGEGGGEGGTIREVSRKAETVQRVDGDAARVPQPVGARMPVARPEAWAGFVERAGLARRG